ncbi:hypothetical protein S40293_08073 [Stachybotrys chartarum IBT 40293]|nr:hypothetical protein S40293_08073 [Stachybotrys chartarum IBT 40293]
MARPRFTDEVLVKLISLDGSHRTRRILLSKAKPDIRIGRTSKKDSALGADEGNGWFDSAVMSREHAMLHLDAFHQKLYIKDTSSLHGTFVNAFQLPPDQSRQVKSRDVLTFGISIVRANETHLPCRLQLSLEFGTARPEEPRTRLGGFRVPDDSDIEEISSDEDEVMERSSHILQGNIFKPALQSATIPIDLTSNDQYPTSQMRLDVPNGDVRSPVPQPPSSSSGPPSRRAESTVVDLTSPIEPNFPAAVTSPSFDSQDMPDPTEESSTPAEDNQPGPFAEHNLGPVPASDSQVKPIHHPCDAKSPSNKDDLCLDPDMWEEHDDFTSSDVEYCSDSQGYPSGDEAEYDSDEDLYRPMSPNVRTDVAPADLALCADAWSGSMNPHVEGSQKQHGPPGLLGNNSPGAQLPPFRMYTTPYTPVIANYPLQSHSIRLPSIFESMSRPCRPQTFDTPSFAQTVDTQTRTFDFFTALEVPSDGNQPNCQITIPQTSNQRIHNDGPFQNMSEVVEHEEHEEDISQIEPDEPPATNNEDVHQDDEDDEGNEDEEGEEDEEDKEDEESEEDEAGDIDGDLALETGAALETSPLLDSGAMFLQTPQSFQASEEVNTFEETAADEISAYQLELKKQAAVDSVADAQGNVSSLESNALSGETSLDSDTTKRTTMNIDTVVNAPEHATSNTPAPIDRSSAKRKAEDISELNPEEVAQENGISAATAFGAAELNLAEQAPQFRTPVPLSQTVPRPVRRRRLRRVVEVVGIAAFGGAAVMGALIATAPTF